MHKLIIFSVVTILSIPVHGMSLQNRQSQKNLKRSLDSTSSDQSMRSELPDVEKAAKVRDQREKINIVKKMPGTLTQEEVSKITKMSLHELMAINDRARREIAQEECKMQ